MMRRGMHTLVHLAEGALSDELQLDEHTTNLLCSCSRQHSRSNEACAGPYDRSDNLTPREGSDVTIIEYAHILAAKRDDSPAGLMQY